jgi:ribosomal protein L32
MALECTLAALAGIDQSDPDAVQGLLRICIGDLLDPALWMWVIGLTVGCALVGALIGWAKGRWVHGLIWGAALGPIGWLVTALSKSNLRECPECGRRNQPSARVCRHCGIDFRKYAALSPRARLKSQERHGRW